MTGARLLLVVGLVLIGTGVSTARPGGDMDSWVAGFLFGAAVTILVSAPAKEKR